jgi:hypothetical protein
MNNKEQTKLKITRDIVLKDDDTVSESYFLWIIYDITSHCICTKKTKEEIFKIVEEIKDSIPELDRTSEDIILNNNKFTIQSENRLLISGTIKVRREYALFLNSRCYEVIYDDYETILKRAESISEMLNPSQKIKNEIVCEIELNK